MSLNIFLDVSESERGQGERAEAGRKAGRSEERQIREDSHSSQFSPFFPLPLFSAPPYAIL